MKSSARRIAPLKRRAVRRVATGVFALCAVYLIADLFWPGTRDLRRFDPGDVARLDTVMWRSYYDRRPLVMFFQLSELMRSQYGMMPVRSLVTAATAARAAFVFKDGKHRGDYERALPYLESFYESIHARSSGAFDVAEAARRELEWWIVHRERARHEPGDLERALAEAAAAVYGLPPERFAEYARFRAEAMAIRDAKAEAGGVTEDDWRRIGETLERSWRALHAEVNSTSPEPGETATIAAPSDYF